MIITRNNGEKTRRGSRAAATFKMERFVIMVNYYHKALDLDVAAALDPPLKTIKRKL